MALAAVILKWRAAREIRDLGFIGESLEGYSLDGFRPLTRTELRLVAMFADEVESAMTRRQAGEE